MFPCFHPSIVGQHRELEPLLAIAQQAGFSMIDLDASVILEAEEQHSEAYVKDLLAKHKLTWAAFGLPVNINTDVAELAVQLKRLQTLASVAARYGVTRCLTWLWPSIDELPIPYTCHRIQTIRKCAEVLSGFGIQLGLEFVGPHHLREKRYPFVYTLTDLLLFIDAIERDNVGVLLDSYHWYTTGASFEELRQLPVEKIVHVHLNDTNDEPAVAHDQKRLLPGEGVIDLPAFLRYLKESGYHGPMAIEVLRQETPTEAPDVLAKRAFTLLDALLQRV